MKQFYLLDLIRGSAALLVVMGHLRSLMFESWNGGNLFKIIFYAVTSLGHQAVIVFFVLSGFFVGGIFIADKNKDIFKYSIKRISRFYTVLIPALVLTWIIDSIGIYLFKANALYGGYSDNYVLKYDVASRLNLETLFANMIYLQDIIYPTFGSNGALWSLAYEFWFYIIFPLLWFLFSSNKRNYKIVAFTLILTMFYFLGLKGFIYLLIWFIGVLVYSLYKEEYINKKIKQSKYKIILILAFICTLLMSFFCRTWGLIADLFLGISFGLLLLVMLNSKGISSIYLKKIATFIANISFSMYAIHLPILVLIIAFFTKGNVFEFNFMNLVKYLIILGCVMGLSFIFWRSFESKTYIVNSYLSKLLRKWRTNLNEFK